MFSTFFIKGKPVFSNGPRSLPKNIFDNSVLADDPSAEALRSLETCVLVNNNLCGK